MRSPEAGEPALSGDALFTRCKTLASRLGKTLDLPVGEISLFPELSSDVALVSLGGRISEVIMRNWGGRHRVVPLCAISDEVLAWAGYRESWGKQGNEQLFRFVEAGFTVHLGRAGEIEKPQLMRSEWVCPRSRSFAENAGHPHWQLDALETSRMSTPAETPRFNQAPALPSEFIALPSAPIDMLRRLTLERMHLASAATWWLQPAQPIAHVPADIAELDRWMLGCISYLRQEIGRCELSGAVPD